MKPIADHLQPGLDVLFVGYNPSIRSGETGHHYANPSNRFWKLLHLSDLTARLYRPEEDRALLELGYGFTNIVVRPTQNAQEITTEEYAVGREILRRKLEQFRPKVACYVGKGVYEQFSGRRRIEWGLQREAIVAGVTDFVAPSSSGLVRMKVEDVAAVFRELRQWLKANQSRSNS